MRSETGASAYILGALLAGCASWAMGSAWWLVPVHAMLSWVYIVWACFN